MWDVFAIIARYGEKRPEGAVKVAGFCVHNVGFFGAYDSSGKRDSLCWLAVRRPDDVTSTKMWYTFIHEPIHGSVSAIVT